MACSPDWDTLDPDLQERATALAWATTRLLTGGMVGSCPVTVRPCSASPCNLCMGWYMYPAPYLLHGVWFNTPPCRGEGCSCQPVPEVLMPGLVARVDAVTVDGVLLDPAEYTLHNQRSLVRTDGGSWPSCQDVTLPDTEVGTFTVTYIPGLEPDPAGLWAVGVLAWEYSKACSPSTAGGKCRLPASVVSISRQGVSMDFDNKMFSNGMTGIREVDAWLSSINPYQLRTPPRVWSPDVPQAGYRFVPSSATVVP
jgi:hypothetical protein